MIERGQPFPAPTPSDVPLFCPLCAPAIVRLTPRLIAAHGPGEAARRERIDALHYEYRCSRCAYIEGHARRVVAP